MKQPPPPLYLVAGLFKIIVALCKMHIVHQRLMHVNLTLNLHFPPISMQASTSTLKQEVKDARKKLSSQDMLRRARLLQEKQDLVNRMIEVGSEV